MLPALSPLSDTDDICWLQRRGHAPWRSQATAGHNRHSRHTMQAQQIAAEDSEEEAGLFGEAVEELGTTASDAHHLPRGTRHACRVLPYEKQPDDV